MTTALRARLHRLRFAALATVSALVIVLGLFAGLVQLALPWVERHPQQVEQWLSQRLGRSVAIGQVRGQWIGGGPVLTLENVRIAAADPQGAPFTVPNAELAFDPWAWFRRNHAVSEFRIGGLDLQLARVDGAWHLHGLDLASQGGDEAFSMGALGAIEIRDSKFSVVDAEHDLDLQLGVPVLRLLNRGAITRVVGRVRLLGSDSPPLELVADLDVNRRSGEIYLGGRDLDLARAGARQTPGGVLVTGGRGDVQVWAHVDAARLGDVRAKVDLREAQFGGVVPIALEGKPASDGKTPFDEKAEVAPRAAFERLAFVARWRREDGGWNLDLADFLADADKQMTPARISIERRGDADHPSYRAGATALPLEPIGSLAMLFASAPEGLRRWLYLAHPRGLVANAGLRWSGAADFEADAQLRGLDLADADRVPGAASLDLDLHGDAQAILLELPPQALRIDYPRVFRKPFLFSQFGGDVIVRPDEDGWHVGTDRLVFEGEGYGGELRGDVVLQAGRRPFLDLYTVVTHGEVVAAKLFWPTTNMSPKAIAWLDRGLVGGRLVGARAALRGDLADWPFREYSGRMIARAEVADLDLIYDANWPRAEKVHAFAAFENSGMQVEVAAAESMGNEIGEASATIADFNQSILDLALKGEGSGASLLGFLRATPIGKRNEDALKDLEIAGKGTVALKLNLPIKQVETLALDGTVDLAGAKVDQRAYNLHFDEVAGQLRFNQKGMKVDGLDAKFRGRPAKLGLAIGGAAADSRHAFEARLTGRYPATTVFADVPTILPALVKFPGESTWNAGVDIDTAAAGGRKRLTLQSDLRGTAIELPAPLAKSADAALPFTLALDLPYAGQIVEATLADLVTARVHPLDAKRPFAARIEFGKATPSAPPAQGVSIGGRAPNFDAGGWIDLTRLGGGDAGGGIGGLLQGIDLRIDDFLVGGRGFGEMRLVVDSSAAASTIRLDGAAAAGTLTIPNTDLARQGVSARFQRVYWPEAPESSGDDDKGTLADTAPSSLPPLHLVVDDFRLGKASFGAAEFESHPIANGMQIEKLQARSPNMEMKASGEWTGVAKNNRSKLAIELTAKNLGQMMTALGFSGLIDGGAARATIDASWVGPPSAFALPRLDGTLDIDVSEGRFPEVEPGAGRIFGLLSLTEIPRRLSLDFSDFFKSGLSFNSIKGKFRLADGNAYTDGLIINSPAADIVVTGRTGLRAKDYDQQMTVSPHAGVTLPIVGAIAGGPVGAAAGLVMQGILHKPLGKVISMRYHVLGSWEKPRIVAVARESRDAKSGDSGKKNPPKSKDLR
ncbi:YhdP family protein [Dokdonella sp.]|uniref:YhdP family protein n=1 Tax=Dokdonella sp. TaxID=2291710 RepID=UPI001B017714|nr:YhdP family protein [Dokdonella sp.]MBO9663581.1 TIGR02099 family protein [Dokdonella sp.]